MYACNGILFNHESPLRGETFVTRKITRGLARIALGLMSTLYLGNLDALRDWGHSRDYIQMQWLMLQQDKPEDYVIATGRQISVREFVNIAANELGITLSWKGSGVDEQAIIETIDATKLAQMLRRPVSEAPLKVGQVIIKIDPRQFRPTEVDSLIGDASKAQQKLGWKPMISFESMVTEMLQEDISLATRDAVCKIAGFKAFNHDE